MVQPPAAQLLPWLLYVVYPKSGRKSTPLPQRFADARHLDWQCGCFLLQYLFPPPTPHSLPSTRQQCIVHSPKESLLSKGKVPFPSAHLAPSVQTPPLFKTSITINQSYDHHYHHRDLQ